MERQDARNIVWHAGALTRARRSALLGQRGMVVWLTGLSGSGKSTAAFAFEAKLVERGVHAFVLDGDNVRHGLNADLGFSPEHRAENIRRVAHVAALMADAAVVCAVSFISPYAADRAMARRVIGEDRFKEVFFETPMEICESRDPKGLYKKARRGEIPDFTGVNAPYEPPASPDLRLDSSRLSPDACAEAMLALLA